MNFCKVYNKIMLFFNEEHQKKSEVNIIFGTIEILLIVFLILICGIIYIITRPFDYVYRKISKPQIPQIEWGLVGAGMGLIVSGTLLAYLLQEVPHSIFIVIGLFIVYLGIISVAEGFHKWNDFEESYMHKYVTNPILTPLIFLGKITTSKCSLKKDSD